MEFWGFLTKSPEQTIAVANFFIALGTVLLAIGIPLSIHMATRQERETFYATLDRTYFEIQKLLIDYPHLAQTDLSAKTADQVTQYNAFAYMVWNFLETIYDYSKEGKREAVTVTWECVLQYEARLHAAWFLHPANRPKFKSRFIEYVEKKNLLKGATVAR